MFKSAFFKSYVTFKCYTANHVIFDVSFDIYSFADYRKIFIVYLKKLTLYALCKTGNSKQIIINGTENTVRVLL